MASRIQPQSSVAANFLGNRPAAIENPITQIAMNAFDLLKAYTYDPIKNYVIIPITEALIYTSNRVYYYLLSQFAHDDFKRQFDRAIRWNNVSKIQLMLDVGEFSSEEISSYNYGAFRSFNLAVLNIFMNYIEDNEIHELLLEAMAFHKYAMMSLILSRRSIPDDTLAQICLKAVCESFKIKRDRNIPKENKTLKLLLKQIKGSFEAVFSNHQYFNGKFKDTYFSDDLLLDTAEVEKTRILNYLKGLFTEAHSEA
jgi:hypothetical protein